LKLPQGETSEKEFQKKKVIDLLKHLKEI